VDFLRDIGKHFSVNQLLARESVKRRLENEESGISFTEFSYALLQSYDFLELYRREGCTVQMGGSDQWGNITAGSDLIRRMTGERAWGVVIPLVTKSDGTKFGKTETGTIWLDPAKTSPYAFYQFWLNTADADAYKFLRYFTFIPVSDIVTLEAEDRAREGRPEAQRVLAEAMTRLVHGDEGLQAALRITQALFNDQLAGLSESDLEQLKLDGLPSSVLARSSLGGEPLTQLLADAGMAASGKQVKDALGRGAVWVNGATRSMDDNMAVPQSFAEELAYFGRFYVCRLGKKKYHLFEIV
jgi:tyrosyl-tRNA synthetase